MASTKIEWADSVFNPVTGCTPISPGCENCYAKRMSRRLAGRCGYPADEPFRVTLHPEKLEEPLQWKKPRRVFVCSMGDLFHDDVPDEYIEKVFNVMDRCGAAGAVTGNYEHTFMVLTKRPDRMREFVDNWWRSYQQEGVEPYMNHIWLGVTAENQQMADERIPILLQTPAVVRFVSCEPLLGPIDLRNYLRPKTKTAFYNRGGVGRAMEVIVRREHLDWVICGGETGPGARPVHPDWVRSLRDQCQAAGVPFFWKSWGEYLHETQNPPLKAEQWGYRWPDGSHSWHVGHKAAGRLLDGRTWDEYPKEA